MSENNEKDREKASISQAETAEDPCAGINDPVRRGLCRVCQVPVIGEAPFCKDHEPPTP